MDFSEMQAQAREVRSMYASWEKQEHGRSWTAEEIVLGLIGDVGDLAKLVQAAEGVRTIPNATSALGHELADCLWAVMTIADAYDVNLEHAFGTTMNELRSRLET